MFCPYCGKQIADESSFCTHCGKDINAIQKKDDVRSEAIKSSPSTNVVDSTKQEGLSGKMIGSVLLFVAGLVGIIMRGDITIAILGRGRLMKEAIFGGGSVQSTVTAIMVIGGIAMIVGVILFVAELKKIMQK